MQSLTRSRWAAIGAAVAVTLGAGGIGLVSATSPEGASTLVSIEPCRLADTRPAQDNVGPRNTPIGEDETLTIVAHGDNGQCTGIPASATGLALNVTAIGATSPVGTFLTIWGAGARPDASHLNPVSGQPPTPNAVDTGLTGTGELNVYNRFGTVDVIVDIVGYYSDHDHDDQYLAVSQDSHAAAAYDEAESLGAVAKVVTSLTVDTPTSGYVLVNASTTVVASLLTVVASCSITTDTAIDTAAIVQTHVTENQQQSLAATRGFIINKGFIASPNETTYNLVCVGTPSASLTDTHLTASFIPDPDAFELIIGPNGP